MFEHSRILNENKMNRICKWIANTGMDCSYFIENHFLPNLYSDYTTDISSLLTNLENSFKHLVEAKSFSPDRVPEETKKQVVNAMLQHLIPNNDKMELLSKVHLPNASRVKVALLKKLAEDLEKFLQDYDFSSIGFGERLSLKDKNIRLLKDKSIDRSFGQLLDYEGSITDDVRSWKEENIQKYYKALQNLANEKLSAKQRQIINSSGYNHDSIVKISKSILKTIHNKLAQSRGEELAKEKFEKPATAGTEEVFYNPSRPSAIEMHLENINDVADYLNKKYKVPNFDTLVDKVKTGTVNRDAVIKKINREASILRSKFGKWRLAHQLETIAQSLQKISAGNATVSSEMPPPDVTPPPAAGAAAKVPFADVIEGDFPAPSGRRPPILGGGLEGGFTGNPEALAQ